MAFNLSSFTAGAGTDISNCTVVPSGFSTELSLSSITSGIALGNTIYTMASAADATTIPNLCGNFIVTYPTTTTSLSLTMPSSPSQFSSVLIVSDIQINNLLIQPNAGQTFLLPPPGSIVVGGVALYSFIGTQWTPI